jgi:hypothetical protein
MKTIISLLSVIFLTGIAIGQDSKRVAEIERSEQLQEEHQKRVEELNERQAELQNPAPRFIDRFVGITGNSWAISLVSEGGFFGFRTIAAINSDKKAYCGFDKDALILTDVSTEIHDKLQTFVERPPVFEANRQEQIAGCKDCSKESLVVSVRSGSTIRSRTYAVSETSPAIFRIYETMYDFAGCREKSN